MTARPYVRNASTRELVSRRRTAARQNRSPSYPPGLAEHGVELAEIPSSGHWSMYANAPELWRRTTAFLSPTDSGDDGGRRPS